MGDSLCSCFREHTDISVYPAEAEIFLEGVHRISSPNLSGEDEENNS